MEQYATLKQTPSYFRMVNKVKTSGDLKTDATCQPSFDYFRQSNTPQVNWGSDKPMVEMCPPKYKGHTGVPTHSIWNNMTKRKSVVLNN